MQQPIETQIKINYKEYPECMFAAFMIPEEGDDLRRVSGNVVFKSQDNQGRT